MRIISKKRIRECIERHPQSEVVLQQWWEETLKESWGNPAEVRKTHAAISVFKSGRLVFNVGGNKFRIIAAVNYDFQIMYLRFVGTHKEYDTVDANEV